MSELRVIPPLEYFRVDRAANILGCEIEDILHWSMTGAIYLNILFPDKKRRYELIGAETNNMSFNVGEGAKYREGVIDITSEWHAEKKFNKLITIDGMICGDEKRPWTGYGGESMVNIFIWSCHDPCRDYSSPKREIAPFGYFFTLIDNKYIDSIIKGGHVDEFYIGAYRESGADSDTAYFTLAMDGRELLNALRIEYKEVQKLQEHIVSGKKFDFDTSKPSPFENKPKNKRNPHEEKREEVYAAAFYALFNWADEIGLSPEQLQGVAASKITEVIFNHSQFLFGKDDPMLGRDKISKLLSTAIKTGKVHKSK